MKQLLSLQFTLTLLFNVLFPMSAEITSVTTTWSQQFHTHSINQLNCIQSVNLKHTTFILKSQFQKLSIHFKSRREILWRVYKVIHYVIIHYAFTKCFSFSTSKFHIKLKISDFVLNCWHYTQHFHSLSFLIKCQSSFYEILSYSILVSLLNDEKLLTSCI